MAKPCRRDSDSFIESRANARRRRPAMISVSRNNRDAIAAQRRRRNILLASVLGLLASQPLAAFEPVQGSFVARRDCPATRGIKASPDGVSVQSGERYVALGLNKREGDYLQIRVPGARPEPRWVARDCGDWPGGNPPDAAMSAQAPNTPSRPRRLLLALSWQPAFCERQPRKRECQTQTPDRFDAEHLSLHGLWPQPQGLEYCGVDARTRGIDRSGTWTALPAPKLEEDTRQRLRQAMPGTDSGLERHEWLRHGSCFGTDADSYFRTALVLLDQINRSKLRDLLVRREGSQIALSELKAAFEESFGPGAGGAMSVRCQLDGQRTLIGEIRLSLRQPLSPATSLSEALDRVSGERDTCQAGMVDTVGNQ